MKHPQYPQVIIHDKPVNSTIFSDPSSKIGEGGEAVVYRLNGATALKIFRRPDDDFFTKITDSGQRIIYQSAAAERIREHEHKLRSFPKATPPRIMAPVELALNQKDHTVAGYTMPLIEQGLPLLFYFDPGARKMGVDPPKILNTFMELHDLISALHSNSRQIIIGDLNPLNVILKDQIPYIVDCDSFQFSPFMCHSFSPVYLDPCLCDSDEKFPILAAPYTQSSDWYAFLIMLFNALLLVNPFGGIYKAPPNQQKVTPQQRSLKRISVFNPHVVYPKNAFHYTILPDELLHIFHGAFEKDHRTAIERKVLEITWQTCPCCKKEHARPTCPTCRQAPAAAIKQQLVIKGNITAEKVAQRCGNIVAIARQGKNLIWAAVKNNCLIREDGTDLGEFIIDPFTQIHLCNGKTVVAQRGICAVISKDSHEIISADIFRNHTAVHSNSHHWYWIKKGVLYQNHTWAPHSIGQVMPCQTLFWVGDVFGFGIYAVGSHFYGFTFGARQGKLNDNVNIEEFHGTYVHGSAHFSDHLCWFSATFNVNGSMVEHHLLIDGYGKKLLSGKKEHTDMSGTISCYGQGTAFGNFLLTVAQEGVNKMEWSPNGLVTKKIPGISRFIHPDSQLLLMEDGLVVANPSQQDIWKIQIK